MRHTSLSACTTRVFAHLKKVVRLRVVAAATVRAAAHARNPRRVVPLESRSAARPSLFAV